MNGPLPSSLTWLLARFSFSGLLDRGPQFLTIPPGRLRGDAHTVGHTSLSARYPREGERERKKNEPKTEAIIIL